MSYTQVGLLLDMSGAVLIFLFGVPTSAVTVGHAKWKDYVSRAGLFLLIAGFGLQLYATYQA